MTDHDPSSTDRPTQPGDRLRRLISSTPEEPGHSQPNASAAESHPAGEPDQTGSWFDAMHQQDEQPGVDRAASPAQAAPPPAEPQKPEQPSGSDGDEKSQSDHHPTGDPLQTGGWYAERIPQPAPSKETSPTLPATSASAADTAPTQPVPVNRQPASFRPTIPPPASDQNGIPLPTRVEEIDPFATRVTTAAYRGPVHASTIAPEAPSKPMGHTQPIRVQKKSWRKPAGCFLRGLIILLFVGVLLAVIAGSIGVYQYYRIAASLPDISDLHNRASQFETTRILDRNGNILYEIVDPNAGKRTYVPLEKISPYLIAATLATEDKEYYNHGGFDPIAIVRALLQNYVSGETVSGASTITQQLARMLLLTPNERNQRTIQRKAREIVLAAEITRRYSKEEILELYLNEINYGSMAYGVEAAAETYFHTTADKLTLAQGSFLAGIPQAPAVYDIFTNRDETLRRQEQVLVLMWQDSQEKNCIEVLANRQPVCVDTTAAANAAMEIKAYEFTQPSAEMRYPHWVNYVRSILEAQYDPQTIYRSGFTVYTTLDPGLQDQAQKIVSDQVSQLSDKHVTDGALVAIRPSTGEILAMVGSADFYNEAISGQVNMAVSPRQPGSSIKPLTYVAAFEKGWTPSTLIWDVPTDFPPSGNPNDTRDPYQPRNYDDRFHGPVTVRTALSNSYNIPAVKTLNFVGIYDNPDTPNEDGLISFARRLGITTLTRDDYGLALTLGGGEVPLLQMTGAYSVFANNGRLVPPVAITRIVDHDGNVVFDYKAPAGEQVVRVEHAYLISSILSDNAARAPMFGTNSVLNLPFQAAVKTGTTNDYRDNWTIGYTPDLAVGVWVGNADYTPMEHTTGVTGAAPIWAQFMQAGIQSLTGGKASPFVKPPGVVERVVCAVSGTEPSEWCPEQRGEYFAADQLPSPKDNDLWQKVKVDTWTGLRASSACSDFTEEKFAINVKDASAVKWIKESGDGKAWAEKMGFSEPFYFAPDRECKADDPHPNLSFSGLSDGQTVTTNPLDIFAVADAPSNFDSYRLEYGVGTDPSEWKVLVDKATNPVKQPDKIYTWDLKDVPAGDVTLKLTLKSTQDTYAEKKIHLKLQVPTPTPTLTPTPTATSTSLPTHTPHPTATPTDTPAPVEPTSGATAPSKKP